MTYCKISPEAGIFSYTPLPNLFIQEYMLKAPGDYIKVYIYGLMHSVYPSMAEQTRERFSAALQMDDETVDKAFQYWKAKGLVKENMGEYEFLDVRNSLFDSKMASNDSRIYEHTALSNALTLAAGSHELTRAEYDLLYDLHDIDNFEESALVMMVEHCAQNYKGKKFTKSRLESIAREWKRAGATTAQKAGEYRTGIMLRNSPANILLNEMGITGRNVSIDEHNLYEKWTNDWGFSLDALKVAREGITGSQYPNFKYFDKRIKTLYERGLNTAKKIRDGENARSDNDELVQSCMFRLGMVGMVTDELRRYYANWISAYGMTHDAILLACDEARALGNSSFKTAESIIASYARRSIFTPEAIVSDREFSNDTQSILHTAGITGTPRESDRERIKAWLAAFPLDVLLFAAELSSGTERPLGYMGRVLENWNKSGARTLDAVQKLSASHSASNTAKKSGKSSTIHYVNEREYSSDEFDGLLEDVLEHLSSSDDDESDDK